MLDSYRERMLREIGNVENYMYPDLIVNEGRQYSRTSSKINSNLTGAPIDEMLTNTIRKLYNSKKWFSKFGKFGLGVLGFTILSQFTFGKNDNSKKGGSKIWKFVIFR